jgi:transcriptional regulator with XRE-family HTH domain
MSEVVSIIRGSGLTQKEIAGILGITAPKVSALMTGKINDFSNDTLMNYLILLGYSVEINVLSQPRRQAPLSRPVKKGVMKVKMSPRRRRKVKSRL